MPASSMPDGAMQLLLQESCIAPPGITLYGAIKAKGKRLYLYRLSLK
jgi:hypothetical protein